MGKKRKQDLLDSLLDKMGKIESAAWLVGSYDETRDGKVKPKLTLKYFGIIRLDKDLWLTFIGSFMKVKKVKIEINLRDVTSVRTVMFKQLKIQWRSKATGVLHNLVFEIGEKSKFTGLTPSKKAAQLWEKLINQALEKIKEKEKRRR